MTFQKFPRNLADIYGKLADFHCSKTVTLIDMGKGKVLFGGNDSFLRSNNLLARTMTCTK